MFKDFCYSIKNEELHKKKKYENNAKRNKNLSDIYVKKGDKLKTKDSIGKIATDPLNGQTILSFSIFNNGVPQNPRFWIYKM